ncbi:GH12420 [Drosophila grimshawi]|uniref:GH12420 n=1 Tax=Drosophila grimshawi TaxID=7222 RepID=B4JJ02_DROGR|nr:GH12420 [Drosophila grimshawi]
MSDEVPLGRLSQIFDTLTTLQQQQQQHHQLQLQSQQAAAAAEERRRSASSSPSPSASASAATSGRATPSQVVGVAGTQTLYYTHTHNYFLRPQDGASYMHTFPQHSTHYFQQQHQQQLQQFQFQQQQQPPSLPGRLSGTGSGSGSGSQSLHASPLLAKRATSFSGQMPLTRAAQLHDARLVVASTPNSPRLMPRCQPRPPPIPAKPSAKELQANTTAASASSPVPAPAPQAPPPQNPMLAALDAPDAPWPHFSTLTEHLDVHQVNNYGQALPEINWQERCLELQLELHRSKNQAGRIRDMLREKVRSN